MQQHWEVIVAFRNGAEIEWFNKSLGEWESELAPSFGICEKYRIKPELKLVPFTFEDADFLIGKSVKSNMRTFELITAVSSEGVIVGDRLFYYQTLLENFTFLDGSPCGKTVE